MNTNNSVDILGVTLSRMPRDEALEAVQKLVAERRSAVVYFVNAHCLNMACSVPGYRETLNRADLLLNDGSGVGWAARRRGKPFADNCVGTDFIPTLCDRGRDKGLSYFLLGGAEGVASKAAASWLTKYPDLKIAGTHHGYIDNDTEAEDRAIEQINQAGTDVLLVAMGMPVQEKWIERNRERLEVGVCFAVGALFDYAADVVPRAPQWMLDRGWEWVYRLYAEPARLWKRYLVGNPLFIARVVKAQLRREARD